jgi:hypothetical protein
MSMPARGISPLGQSLRAHLATGPPRGSLRPFGPGHVPLSVPLQNGVRFLHDPLPATAGSILQPSLCGIAATHRIGLTLFRTRSTSQEGSTFLPAIICQRTPTKQGGSRSLQTYQSIRSGRA